MPSTPSSLNNSIWARLISALLGATGIFLTLALISYHPADVSLLASEPNQPLANLGGAVGAWIGFFGRAGFGVASLFLPLACVVLAFQLWDRKPSEFSWAIRLIGCAGLLAAASVLAALSSGDSQVQQYAGGMSGYLLVRTGRYYFGSLGTGLLAGCLAFLSWILATEQLSVPRLVQSLWSQGVDAVGGLLARVRLGGSDAALAGAGKVRTAAVRPAPRVREEAPALPSAPTIRTTDSASDLEAPRIRSTVVKQKPKVLTNGNGNGNGYAAAVPKPGAAKDFELPSLDMLVSPPPMADRQQVDDDDLQLNARILEETLREFGIEVRCVNIDRGPAVTRYEMAPAPGVKITKIVSLADDLAMVLKAASCHVVAPIPGKGLVGIEAPNSKATTIYLKEIIGSKAYQQLRSPLALPVGTDVSGLPVVTDLRDCPHLMIAGATGSGKTVCLNSVLTGILCQAGPDEVQFLMIDPKKVELVLFNKIPHLVAPVVTDAKQAAVALAWAVEEMEQRYQRLASIGARNIVGYNEKVHAQGENDEHRHMPYLVIVIDELADLMMTSAQEVEASITRLAQLSRAVGIHIILATQRPSVDVITGVIKANFPARIAFQVASKVDSRTILDVNGADKLLGRGDLMFLRPGTAKPIRAQGALVTDAEIERIVTHLKSQRAPVYNEALMHRQQQPPEAAMLAAGDKDELYEMAKKLVIDSGQASTSLLQRRLRLGYGRAARMLDLMEQEGIVGPPQGSRPREVLVSPQQAGASPA